MKQPKFKFGDKVIKKGWLSPMIVRVVVDRETHFRYSESIDEKLIHETDLVLFEEPKPKKLYAYSFGSQLMFFSNEVDNGSSWKRSPEYDITYPGVDPS